MRELFVQSEDKLSWTESLEPKVNKKFIAIIRTFSKHILGYIADREKASLIAISWSNSLTNKINKDKIELTLDEKDLFYRVYIAFQTLSNTYASMNEEKHNNIIDTQPSSFFKAKQNYNNAARTLQILCNSQRYMNEDKPKSGPIACPESLPGGDIFFPMTLEGNKILPKELEAIKNKLIHNKHKSNKAVENFWKNHVPLKKTLVLDLED